MQSTWNSVLPAGDAHTRIYPAGPYQPPAISGVAVMQIIVPTRNRIYEQITLQSLPRELRERTTLVCPKREVSELHRLYPDVTIAWEPYRNMKIAQKREWIVRTWFECGYDKIIMLDDDLSFATRVSPDDWHLRPIQGEELISEFERIEEKLSPDFPHVGFGMRQNNNQESGGWKSPARMLTALGYYLPIVTKCKWDLVELREDNCVTLQLLLMGHPNAVWTGTVVEPRFDTPGGCRTYRTIEMSNAEAEKLAALFPGYVSLRKNYKASVPRLEVTCHWQKALQDGLANSAKNNSQHH